MCSDFLAGAVNRDFWTLEVLLLRSALARLRDVNLDVQISWQAQYFAC